MSRPRQHRTSAIDEAVESYEAARSRDGRADLEEFLPAPDHPLYLAVLCELVRVDLEYDYERNRTSRLEHYERRFPELFRDPGRAREIAFEESRLRRQAGKSPSATGYRDPYGADHLDRPATSPDPELAYEPAGPLQEDPRRRLDGIPERTAEPTVLDRPTKRARRRPRLSSIAGLVAVSLAIIAALATWMIARRYRIDRLGAQDSLERLTARVGEEEFLLGVPDAPMRGIDEGIALCRQAVETYGAGAGPQWLARPAASMLSEGDRIRLRREMGELLGLWARALIWRAEMSADRRAERIAEAERLIGLAEASYGSAGAPRDLKIQSAALARLAGRDAEADRLLAEAETVRPGSARERLVLASTYLGRGMDREALALAEEASQLDPLDSSAWLIRGHCHAQLAQNERADQSFSLGIALRPGFHWAYFHRGRVALERRDFDRALADFDRLLEAIPDQPDALLNRALAKLERGDAPGAIADLDRLLGRAGAPTRALFLRSRAHQARGDRAAAEADRREGIARVPDDELSWVARGLNRLAADPAAALEDFRTARKLNPKSLRAIQGEASVLSETLGRPEEAVKALDKAVAFHPQSAPALAGRSVLLARLGRREDALKDAAASLSLDDSAETLYKAACTYALTSAKVPGDGGEALRLLTRAIRKDGTLLGRVDADPDLAPVRARPEFARLRDALRLIFPPTDHAR